MSALRAITELSNHRASKWIRTLGKPGNKQTIILPERLLTTAPPSLSAAQNAVTAANINSSNAASAGPHLAPSPSRPAKRP